MGTFIDDANREYVEALIDLVPVKPHHKLCMVTFYLTPDMQFIGTSMLFTNGAMRTGKNALRAWCSINADVTVCKTRLDLLNGIEHKRGVYVSYDWTDSGRLMSQGKFDHTELKG